MYNHTITIIKCKLILDLNDTQSILPIIPRNVFLVIKIHIKEYIRYLKVKNIIFKKIFLKYPELLQKICFSKVNML